MPDVALVSMPFAPLPRPSIALGILKACLEQEGISTRVWYLNLAFAERCGPLIYSYVSEGSDTNLMGDWAFGAAAFPEWEVDSDTYLKRLGSPLDEKHLRRLRDQAPDFVRQAAREILHRKPRIVGASSTFQQHVPSLALLKHIKEQQPQVITVLGGANCEGCMGRTTLEAFPWVDFVVTGEAEQTFPALCRILLADPTTAPATLPPGVLGPRDREQPASDGNLPRPLLDNMDDSPIPDFSEFFSALEEHDREQRITAGLPIETSRGCWWGEQQQCLFCGLNGEGLRFRTKSPQRILQELERQSARYGTRKFEAMDNVLPPTVLEQVFPELGQADPPYTLLYEVKPNLGRRQLETLAAAGVRWIQPGIESLHPGAYRLLNKGNRSWQAVALLKWALELGIFVSWNFLVGFPGEEDEWYGEVADWLPLLAHLQAPPAAMHGLMPVRYDRFSPYFCEAEQYQLHLRPHWAYAYAYPLGEAQLSRLAYYFEDHGNKAARPGPHTNRLAQVMRDWFHLFYARNEQYSFEVSPDKPTLTMEDTGRELLIRDSRPCATATEVRLQGTEAHLYRACDAGISREQLATGHGLQGRNLDAAVTFLKEKKLLLELEGRLLALATRAPLNPLPRKEDCPAGYVRQPTREELRQKHKEPGRQSVFSLFGGPQAGTTTSVPHAQVAAPEAGGDGGTHSASPVPDTTPPGPTRLEDRESLAQSKRFLEAYMGDGGFREKVLQGDFSDLARIRCQADPEALRPLWDSRCKTKQPLSPAAAAYRAYIAEQEADVRRIREACEPQQSAFRTWRRRQMARCSLELYDGSNDNNVYAPLCFELSKGCSVGCWFCSIAPESFQGAVPYTSANRDLWRAVLHEARELIGPAAGQGFCYWGTEPFDNPQYEQFCIDFHDILGNFPQTTTARALADPARTRALLSLSEDRGGDVNRFSILSLSQLHRVLAEFSPQELLQVELICQNREADTVKANVGRFREARLKNPSLWTQEKERFRKALRPAAGKQIDEQALETLLSARTPACVAGFLVNMLDKSVQLISPCRPTDDRPRGYIVHDSGTFNNGRDFRRLLEEQIERHMPLKPAPDQVLRFRAWLSYRSLPHGFALASDIRELRFENKTLGKVIQGIGEMIQNGKKTASELALLAYFQYGIAEEMVGQILTSLFQNGVLAEAPQ